MMSRKGFTLIELVVSISLIMIIFSIGIGGYKIYKGRYRDIEINQNLYEIEDTLSYGEIYCKNNKVDGIFYVKQNSSGLIVGLKDRLDKKIRSIELSNSLRLDNNNVNLNEMALNINSKGKIQPGSIKFKDIDGKKYELTVRVGVNLITIWEWNTVYD